MKRNEHKMNADLWSFDWTLTHERINTFASLDQKLHRFASHSTHRYTTNCDWLLTFPPKTCVPHFRSLALVTHFHAIFTSKRRRFQVTHNKIANILRILAYYIILYRINQKVSVAHYFIELKNWNGIKKQTFWQGIDAINMCDRDYGSMNCYFCFSRELILSKSINLLIII